MKSRSTFQFDFSIEQSAAVSESQIRIEEISLGGLTIGRIYDFHTGDLGKLERYDAIAIRYSNPVFTRHLVSSIRSTRQKFIYLLPIFIESSADISSSYEQDLTVDGMIQYKDELRSKLEKIRYLSARAREIRLVQFVRYDDGILYALLSFLYTRSIESVIPKLDASTRVGYRYPLLSDFDLVRPHNVSHLSILDKAENVGYLNGHFHDVSYVCNQCSSGFLQFREVCPSCHSAHIGSQEMVHHFRCAHVAPISEYTKMEGGDRSLHCPKCDHSLKHIGVDYDKPSEIHQCQTCDHEFQYYAVRAKCTNCGTDQQVEHLAKKKFKSYEITQKAIAALKDGRLTDSIQNDPNTIEGAIGWDLFSRNIEFEKKADDPNRRHVVRMQIIDLDIIRKKIGIANTHKLLCEIIQVIRASQQSDDYSAVRIPIDLFYASGHQAKTSGGGCVTYALSAASPAQG